MKVSNFNVIRMVFIILQVFTEYFKELEEESIRDNFVIIYELLDELVDFGYPQFTETKILQEYVTITLFCYNNSNCLYSLYYRGRDYLNSGFAAIKLIVLNTEVNVNYN